MTDNPDNNFSRTISIRIPVILTHLQLLMMAGTAVMLWFDYAIDWDPDWEWVNSRHQYPTSIFVFSTIYSLVVLVPLAFFFPVMDIAFERSGGWRWYRAFCLLIVITFLHVIYIRLAEMSLRTPRGATAFVHELPMRIGLGLYFACVFEWYWLFLATTVLHIFRLFTAFRISGFLLSAYTAWCALSVASISLLRFQTLKVFTYRSFPVRAIGSILVVLLFVAPFLFARFSLRKSYRLWRDRKNGTHTGVYRAVPFTGEPRDSDSSW